LALFVVVANNCAGGGGGGAGGTPADAIGALPFNIGRALALVLPLLPCDDRR
jgi:hypothetical protein